MKLPNSIKGTFRRYSQEVVIHSGGITPQDYCEDLCFENFETGSDDHQECLENCRG